MQHFTGEFTDSASSQRSGCHTANVADTSKSTDLGEFVLDLTLPSESDYSLITSSFSNDQSLPARFYNSGTPTVPKGTKRRFDTEDISEVDINHGTRSSGYESDTEVGEQYMDLKRKKMKIRYSKYKAQRSPSNATACSEKRKYCEEEDRQQIKKRSKKSLPGEYDQLSSSDSNTNSNSGSNTSSSSHSCSYGVSSTSSDDASSSDFDTLDLEEPCTYINPFQGKLQCPESCVCKIGQSRSLVPLIVRRRQSIQPLYMKVLQRRLLSTANTFSHTCCHQKCCLNWVRSRISLGQMVEDYEESDLRVDRFSWGQWKQTPEVQKSSSDEDWFW